LVVEYDDGWHLWRVDKTVAASRLDSAGQGHQHLVGPLESFLDAQDAAVVAFDQIADDWGTAGPPPDTEVYQTFNIGEDDEADTLVMYGVPRHEVNDPAALRKHLLNLYAKQHRAWTALAKLYPLASNRANELRTFQRSCEIDADDGRYSRQARTSARKEADQFRAKINRFEAAESALMDLGVPLSDRE